MYIYTYLYRFMCFCVCNYVCIYICKCVFNRNLKFLLIVVGGGDMRIAGLFLLFFFWRSHLKLQYAIIRTIPT